MFASQRDITKFSDRSSKKRDLGDQSKEGNSGDEWEKIRREKSSIGSLRDVNRCFCREFKISYMCRNSFFNCLRNVEKQMKEIFILAKATQEQKFKGERQQNDLHNSAQFISDKFKEYEEGRAKIIEIIGNLQSGVRTFKT